MRCSAKRLFAPFIALGLAVTPVTAQEVVPTARIRTHFDSLRATEPAFEQYRVPVPPPFTPAHPDVTTSETARRYRTQIREAVAAGPNFAGHYTLVEWGCGSGCQVTVVVDARTGRVFDASLTTAMGTAYRLDSDLLLADPADTLARYFGGDTTLFTCGSCGTPAAYRWTGQRFEPVGPGPHPHLPSSPSP